MFTFHEKWILAILGAAFITAILTPPELLKTIECLLMVIFIVPAAYLFATDKERL